MWPSCFLTSNEIRTHEFDWRVAPRSMIYAVLCLAHAVSRCFRQHAINFATLIIAAETCHGTPKRQHRRFKSYQRRQRLLESYKLLVSLSLMKPQKLFIRLALSNSARVASLRGDNHKVALYAHSAPLTCLVNLNEFCRTTALRNMTPG